MSGKQPKREKKIKPLILVGIENTERRRDLTGFTEIEKDKEARKLTIVEINSGWLYWLNKFRDKAADFPMFHSITLFPHNSRTSGAVDEETYGKVK